MSRSDAISSSLSYFDSGAFLEELDALVQAPSESQRSGSHTDLKRYLTQSISPHITAIGATTTLFDNPDPKAGPVLLATRIEDPALPTILSYGHGDTVLGQSGQWEANRNPFAVTKVEDRIYGRGTADNKGQHLINLAALAQVLKARGSLGFNLKFVIETGEEIGSPGLNDLFAKHPETFGADVLIGSDGMRLARDLPTLVMGTRGVVEFRLECNLREGAHHSGNFGGLIADPAMRLAQALSVITDARGQIAVPEWRPNSLTPEIRQAIADCPVGESGPTIEPDWGEADLTPSERVFGWNSFAILAMKSGQPEAPMGAISPSAMAYCQLRYVVGTDEDDIIPALKRHLVSHGFPDVELIASREAKYSATRVSPKNPWVARVARSIETTLDRTPAILPNAGGSLPNAMFTETLGLPTIWIPHSYAGCSQHAPNEHLLASVAREALELMTGLWWDLGAPD